MESTTHHLRNLRVLLPSFVNGTAPPQIVDSLLADDLSHAIAPSPRMADSVLAESMNQMSLQEREKVYEDVHGVAQQWIPEEPKFVISCLAELQTELDRIPTDQKNAYDLAYSQDSTYVTNRKFRLLFLRSESFQPKAAAQKMVGFLDAKLELFGSDKLSRDILLSDYDASDVKCLESGLYQLLPGRDRSGRTVLFCANGIAPPSAKAINKIRTIWYLAMAALEDEDTQRGGLVSVNFNLGKHHGLDRDMVWKTCKLVNRFPCKIVAMHFCYNDPKLDLMLALGTYTLDSKTRTRLRAHSGSEMECIYKLTSFGITKDLLPVSTSGKDLLPISTSGKVNHDNHMLFLQRRHARDASLILASTTTTSSPELSHLPPLKDERVVVPRPFDILQGRGRHFMSHPGNARLQAIINGYAEQYERAEVHEKTALAQQIVAIIQKPEQLDGTTSTTSSSSSSSSTLPGVSGRFLIQDDSGWKILDDETARGRVSHKFRNLRLRPSSKHPPSNNNHNNTKRLGSISTATKAATTTTRKGPHALLRRDEDAITLTDDGMFGCFSACKRQKM